ncbi:helix-turn-helix domain-containing protein [Polynucleobacter sp. JS-Safj-400b-B2]|uniref:YdaS family helix-turn-helix protein n=1 Tax=Polynucleobacter sp. JS-Safj-400b-B2 TaxID=2576921 RepID=UPI001C0B188A|nr:YdaS family helix-turn-helix protein [Polynucleobacter sp. JS-Safj-400b-B2]MBU3625709.1 helix-turn-helix domain-containing protein [Polynucleobacter sp. JS-Safj-400b-B2]
MDKLLKFLNSLETSQQKAFADKCGTSVGYLRNAVSSNKLLGAELCVLIEQESAGEVIRRELCPSCWKERWPELAEKEGV